MVFTSQFESICNCICIWIYICICLCIYLYLYRHHLNPAQWGLTACVVHIVITPQFATNRKQFRDQPGEFLEQGGKFRKAKGANCREEKRTNFAQIYFICFYSCITTTVLITADTLILQSVFCTEKVDLFLDCELSVLSLSPAIFCQTLNLNIVFFGRK